MVVLGIDKRVKICYTIHSSIAAYCRTNKKEIMDTFWGTIESMNGWQEAYTLLATLALVVYALLIPIRVTKEIRRRVRRRAKVRSVESTLQALLNELPSLRRDLVNIRSAIRDEPLTALVRFFNVISPWYDRELNQFVDDLHDVKDARFDFFLTPLTVLVKHFYSAGRNQYGWNRTAIGQLVTDNDVYIGNIHGLWTHPVSAWKSVKNEPKGSWGFSDEYFRTRNAYDVIADAATDFMSAHIDSMINLIDVLTRRDNQSLHAA